MTDHQHLLFDIGSGRQGNLYAGDSQNSNLDPTTNDILSQLFGKETNTLYRDNYALTHEGEWSWGDSKLIAQFDRTKTSDYPKEQQEQVKAVLTVWKTG